MEGAEGASGRGARVAESNRCCTGGTQDAAVHLAPNASMPRPASQPVTQPQFTPALQQSCAGLQRQAASHQAQPPAMHSRRRTCVGPPSICGKKLLPGPSPRDSCSRACSGSPYSTVVLWLLRSRCSSRRPAGRGRAAGSGASAANGTGQAVPAGLPELGMAAPWHQTTCILSVATPWARHAALRGRPWRRRCLLPPARLTDARGCDRLLGCRVCLHGRCAAIGERICAAAFPVEAKASAPLLWQ